MMPQPAIAISVGEKRANVMYLNAAHQAKLESKKESKAGICCVQSEF